MSTINVRFIAIDAEQGTTKSGKSYDLYTVTFRNLTNDKVESKKVLPFGSREVFSAVAKLAEDGFDKAQAYAISRTKGDAGYWEWTDISRQDGEMKPQVQSANKPQYETADERAQRQVWIIRQSSIAAAANLFQGAGDQEAVLKAAEAFEKFVLRGEVL